MNAALMVLVLTPMAFAFGMVTGRMSYRRSLMKALERLAHPTSSAGLDHELIRRQIETWGRRTL